MLFDFCNLTRTGFCLLCCLLPAISLAEAPTSAAANTPGAEIDANQSVKLSTDDTKVESRADTLEAIDAGIAVALYELELAQYRLRRAELIKHRPTASEAELLSLLPKPKPPQLGLSEVVPDARVNGLVTVALICNFQSVNCARVQGELQALRNQYFGKIRWHHIDYPQHFHRFDVLAAIAHECAAEQGQAEVYARLLYERQYDLTRALFSDLAKVAKLEPANFASCFEASQAKRQLILAAKNRLEDKGINKVPVLLVDGHYYPFPFSWSEIETRLSKALAEIEKVLARSELPLQLLSTVVMTEGESTAEIQVQPDGKPQFFQEQTEIFSGVRLAAIQSQRIILNENGALRYVPLSGNSAQNSNSLALGPAENPLKDFPNTPSVTQGAASEDTAEDDAVAYAALPAQLRVNLKALNREDIDEQVFLSHFHRASHEVEGNRLVKLKGIADEPLFRELGLQENDVVIRVGEEWHHENNPALLEQLKGASDFRLALIRKGRPVIIDYYNE